LVGPFVERWVGVGSASRRIGLLCREQLQDVLSRPGEVDLSVGRPELRLIIGPNDQSPDVVLVHHQGQVALRGEVAGEDNIFAPA
jgi:hypothetical protein